MKLCSYCHTFMEGAPLRKKTCSVKCRKALSRSKEVPETPEIKVIPQTDSIPASLTGVPDWAKDIFKPTKEPKVEPEEKDEYELVEDL